MEGEIPEGLAVMKSDVYYLKQTYKNKFGHITYTEVHKVDINDNRIHGTYLLTRKYSKEYVFYIRSGISYYSKRRMNERFRNKCNRITLEVVPFREVEDLIFLEVI